MSGILDALILQILVPEVIGVIKRRHADVTITDKEVIAALHANADGIIARGRAFLARTTTPG